VGCCFNEAMISINGVVTKGESSASGEKKHWNGYGSIYHQVNFFKENYPLFAQKLSNCEMGTINLTLEKGVNIVKWEYTFDKVYWLPESNDWFEKVSFLPIILKFKGNYFDSWIYKAYKSPHVDNKLLVEVIAPFIHNITDGDQCEIKVKRKFLE